LTAHFDQSLNIGAVNEKIFEIKQRQGPIAARETTSQNSNRKDDGRERPVIMLDLNLSDFG
jgi:hypothetical protein